MSIVQQEFAERFAAEWVASWNSHDLERVLSHYTDDFTMTSPYIVQWFGDASGTLHGKEAVRAYWAQALERVPDLRFELLTVFLGVDSLTLHYRNQAGRLVAEVLHLNEAGIVLSGSAHYAD